MNEQEYQLKSGKPACIVPGCKKDTYGGSRGMCINHYVAKQQLVKRGRTTWFDLEAIGKAKPLLTKEENSALRKKETRLYRVWSPNLGQFIFVKKND